MLNFTVGPVMSDNIVLEIGGEQTPYFRTSEFSELMLENERLLKKFMNAGENARAVFITGSGTAGMEAAVACALTKRDRAVIINGGSFGQRFADLCMIHDVPYSEFKLDFGGNVTDEMLFKYRYSTALLVNACETSTGVLYDLSVISRFCRKHDIFLIVDAISSFLADELDMLQIHADIVIVSSQKALACPPGISAVVMSERALDRIRHNNSGMMYLDIKRMLGDADRGQTPFTPAVGILRQINARLKMIDDNGGAAYEIEKTRCLAKDFRAKIVQLPFKIAVDRPSNAVTALRPEFGSAYDLFLTLKDKYGIWVCPNGGGLKDKVFRVGHIGALTVEDNDTLVAALTDITK